MSNYFIGEKEYFKGIKKIEFEGAKSDNNLAFHFYDENKKVGKKTLKEHLHFAVAYWHGLSETGMDPFGAGTRNREWFSENRMTEAMKKVDAAFEFFTKLGVNYYAFHDVDLIKEAPSLKDFEKEYFKMVYELEKRQKETGVKLLWNTANLFSNKKFMNGAMTNPNFYTMSQAAMQIKMGLEAAVKLNAQNYVFWGGREGYMSLWNTDLKLEQDNLAMFLTITRDYAKKIGFKGTLLLEPKPMEPSKHQYDFDVASCLGFLRKYKLEKDFKLNIEVNHATLAGHTFEHEIELAIQNNALGSIDANRGDQQNGWDTDQFPTNIYDLIPAIYSILKNGGLGNGGVNFDAKLRRNSTDLEDLFYAHIGAMDSFSCALELANAILEDGSIEKIKKERYASFNSEEGKNFVAGKIDLESLVKIAYNHEDVKLESGKQELVENLINNVIFNFYK